jgi:hypothetical protein
MGLRDDRTDDNKKRMIEALRKHAGCVTHAAEEVGIARQTHYDYVHDDEDYKKAWIESRQGAVDLAEVTLQKAMEEGGKGAVTAAIFIAKTIGKDRGYVERQEINQTTTHVNPPTWLDGEEKE